MDLYLVSAALLIDRTPEKNKRWRANGTDGQPHMLSAKSVGRS